MKLAAIDIGSNAVRLQITRIIEYQEKITFKKLEYVRFPIRLGQDVFSIGHISPQRKTNLFKLLRAFKHIIDLYEIDHYYGCATSAMRESENGSEICSEIKSTLGLPIQILSGTQEAEMINRVIQTYIDDQNHLHIDVGGGSTELNLYVNREKVLSHSFPIGSVRSGHSDDVKQTRHSLLHWIDRSIHKKYGRIRAIGTGGNINKIFELAKGDKRRRISIDTVMAVHQTIQHTSPEDRINRLQLNPDRAEVILPAAEIYIDVMKAAHARSILVPSVGLKDGINYYLYEKHYPGEGKIIVKN
ncbi:MAG: phosphatase [Cyclobacteriaceae bacterium]|nr:phosphatase [Cyclobacteriaceae bacterium]